MFPRQLSWLAELRQSDLPPSAPLCLSISCVVAFGGIVRHKYDYQTAHFLFLPALKAGQNLERAVDHVLKSAGMLAVHLPIYCAPCTRCYASTVSRRHACMVACLNRSCLGRLSAPKTPSLYNAPAALWVLLKLNRRVGDTLEQATARRHSCSSHILRFLSVVRKHSTSPNLSSPARRGRTKHHIPHPSH